MHHKSVLYRKRTVSDKCIRALKEYPLRNSEVFRNFLYVLFYLFYSRFPEFLILKIRAEQAMVVRIALRRLQISVMAVC